MRKLLGLVLVFVAMTMVMVGQTDVPGHLTVAPDQTNNLDACVKLMSLSGGNTAGICAPASLAGSYTVVMPGSNSAGVLTNDGSGGLSWGASSAPPYADATVMMSSDTAGGHIYKGYSNSSGVFFGMDFYRYGGTSGTPADMPANGTMMWLRAHGQRNSSLQESGGIRMLGDSASGNFPTSMIRFTVMDSAGTKFNPLTLRANGDVEIADNTGAAGGLRFNGTNLQWSDDLSSWNNFSSGGGSYWSRTGTNTYLTNAGDLVGIGTSSPAGKLHVVQEDFNWIDRYTSVGANLGAGFSLRRARGTSGSPTTVLDGDSAGKFLFYFHDGTSFVQTTSIEAVANGTVATGSVPSDLTFGTGAASPTERVRITSAGYVGIGTTSPSTLLHVNGVATLASHLLFTAPSTADIGDSTNYAQTLYVENINAAPASVIGNYTKIRKLEVVDQSGGTGFWDIQVANTPTVSSLIYARDNAGTTVMRLVQTESSASVNQAQFLLHLVPGNGTTNADNTYDVGTATRSWRGAYFDGTVNAYALVVGAGGCTGCSSTPFSDASAIIKGSADATKLLRFEVDGFTTATTRVVTPPNADATLAGINLAQTWTATQTFQHIQFPAASTYDIGDSTNYVQTLYIENINAAPASVVANYTKVRKLEITDQAGGTTFWDFQVSQSASASSLYYVRDNAGTTVHRLVQTESSSAINQAQFLLHLVPGNGTTNADNTYDLGSASRSWRTAYIDTSLVHSGITRIDSSGNLNGASLQIGGTQTINPSREWASGNFSPSIDNSYRVGNTLRRWIDFYASTGYYILDNSFVVRLNADGNSVFGRNSSGTTQWTISTTNGTMEVLNWYIANGQSGITTTKTVRDSAGTGTCTLVFTGGLLTGGTC